MPQLKCTVQTCVHNKQFLCDLDEITVGGESAKNPKETCCDSFQERKEGSYTNSMKEASDCSCSLIVRQQIVCIIKSVNAMQEKSA